MRAIAIIPSGLLSLVCVVLPGALRADTMYSFSGTYAPYNVSISFDTSLMGAALDNLSVDNITSTVSGFLETNTIPGNGSAALNVTISTNALGNITAFSITDVSDQVVTNTQDSGQTPGTPETFTAPPKDNSGAILIDTINTPPLINAIYLSGGLCVYDDSEAGQLIDDSDGGSCPLRAVDHPATSGTPVTASGSGLWTSNPPNPGAPTAVPEVNGSMLLGTELLGFLALVRWRSARTGHKFDVKVWAPKRRTRSGHLQQRPVA